MHKALGIKMINFKSMWFHTRKKMSIKAFTAAVLNTNWTWMSTMTEQISGIWMFQAMLCVFKKYFLLENIIFTFEQ